MVVGIGERVLVGGWVIQPISNNAVRVRHETHEDTGRIHSSANGSRVVYEKAQRVPKPIRNQVRDVLRHFNPGIFWC